RASSRRSPFRNGRRPSLEQRSLDIGGQVDKRHRQAIRLNGEPNTAAGAGDTGDAGERPVVGVDAGILDRRRGLERLEDLADVKADLVPLGVDAPREPKMICAVAEPHASGNAQLLELT